MLMHFFNLASQDKRNQLTLLIIEGFHDAVRTYVRTILPRSLASFLYGAVWRKTTKSAFSFD